ncbi:mitotic-spindle organizing protein 2A [Trichonephila clavipes]|nr:mitotic-spindle organizing protein 2A [Trichonephila clavipes]
MATLKPVKQKKKSGEKWTSSIFAFDPAATRRVHPCSYFLSEFWLDFPPVVRMACEIKLLESEATTGFFVLLGEQGNKAVLSWVMKGLISSRYECPKCKKGMRLVERKGRIDGFEWRCRVQSKENPHFVCRSVRKGMWFRHSRLSICVILRLTSLTLRLKCGCGSQVVKVSDHDRHVMSLRPVPLKTHRVGQQCTLNLPIDETSPCLCGVVGRRRRYQLRCRSRHLSMVAYIQYVDH